MKESLSMIQLIFLLLSLNLWSFTDRFDLNYGAQGRTLPALGAETFAESGYNHLLWGEKKETHDYRYGLVRPSLAASSSGVINSFKAELEVFPISFLGFAAGRQYVHSNFDFNFFDCSEVTCQGEYRRNYIESKMALGHKGWILVGNYKIDSIEGPLSSRPLADWRNVIVGNPRHDLQIEKKVFVGKSFNNKMAGVLYETVQFQGSRERKESFFGVFQIKKEHSTYLLGAGGFHSDRQPMGFQLYLRFNQVVWPSLKLF